MSGVRREAGRSVGYGDSDQARVPKPRPKPRTGDWPVGLRSEEENVISNVEQWMMAQTSGLKGMIRFWRKIMGVGDSG